VTATCIAAQPILDIGEIIRAAVHEWQSQSTEFPDLGPAMHHSEQRRRERRADQCIRAVESELKALSPFGDTSQRVLNEITTQVVDFIPAALDLDQSAPGPCLRELLRDGMAEVGLELARRARQLDPTVSIIDILQAARNAWVACGLQLMLGKPMQLTPSIFAYSMLYPYSDNFLDDPATTRDDKLAFSERFERRLEGERLPSDNGHESIIWELVGMIEDEYPRFEFADVWASVLAIHHAQTRSISQMHREGSAFNGANRAFETLDLTITKGGASVLVDAYLAAGHLTAYEAKVAFDWGVVLQLGDDLQDLKGDTARGSLTLFTGASAFGPLDGVTNKTFRFSQSVMREVAALPTCPAVVTQLLERSSRMFLIRSVAGAAPSFSKAYLHRLEQHSPFRFGFLKSRERRCYRRRRQYGQLLETTV
jgi:hypothetical protein